MVTTMAVKTSCVVTIERFVSKNGCVRIVRFIKTQNNYSWVIKDVVVIPKHSLHQNTREERVVNVGVAASRSDVGDRHNLNSQGGNITMINYYGSQYAQAHANPSTQMDPEKFTKPLVDLAVAEAGPALKSPTVEEMGYSDRIIQLTAGNSTITSQEAASAIVGYGVWPDYDPGVGHAIDKESKPGPAVDRFYTFDSVDWNANQDTTGGWFYRFPGCLTDMGVFGQNCQYHFLMRYGLCVHVQVNASKFHQGALLVVMVPEAQTDSLPDAKKDIGTISNFRRTPIPQLTIFPHQIINLRTNNSATIVFPYINSTPAENAFTHNQVTLMIIPLVKLRYQSGATTVVPITVSVAPMYTSFSGLRNAVAQGVPTFQVPGSTQFMTTLKNDGFPALPEFEETPAHNIPGEVRNLMEIAQIDTFCNFADSSYSITIDVKSQTTLDGKIKDIDLSLTAVPFQSTYIGRLAKFFTHYRGSLNLTFIFTGSAMATGKFLLAYTPPGGNAPATRRDAMLGTHMIWDVGLQSSVVFTVPYISQSQYRYANVDGNILSYDGYITLFYQTGIVVPPGAPTTCQILVMASAAKDFVFRLATDNAFYQGIGDDIGKLVTGSVRTALESIDTKATGNAPEVRDHLTIHSGDSVALTAPETGASATTEAGSVMETRSVPTTYSRGETDVNIFLSRYARFWAGNLTAGTSTEGGEWRVIDLEFGDNNTHNAVRSKYSMFTYLRMGFDIVVIVSPRGNLKANNQQPTRFPPKFQLLYIPVGAPVPNAVNSAAWYVPTSPTVYFNLNEAPPSLRIPYVGMASTYCAAYDGWGTFSKDPDSSYGKFPGNVIGKLAIRVVTGAVETTSDQTRYEVVMYARPTNIRAFLPRPIISFKNTTSVRATTGRVVVVDTEEESNATFHHGAADDGSDVIVWNTGPKAPITRKYKLKKHYIKVLSQTYFACDQDGYYFHIFPISRRHALIPYHLCKQGLTFGPYGAEMYDPVSYTILIEDPSHDLSLIETYDEYFQYTTPLCMHKDRDLATVACNNIEHKWGRPGMCHRAESLHVMDPYEHDQHHMFRFGFPIPPGFCGSPMFCEDGVCGMATATSQYFSYFTCLADVEWIPMYVETPMEQGPVDWFTGIAEQMGEAFGSSVFESVREEVRNIANKAIGVNPRVEMAKELILWLVKSISACVLLARSYDKVTTAATLGVILGMDLLIHSPFDWLQKKVNECIGIMVAEEQGPSDWIKEFNAACTAAKGMEWIGQKISQFVEWVKSLFKKENKRRTKFISMLEDLPTLMESIDKIMAARGKYRDEDVRRVCSKMRQLKLYADVFGVERNQATFQIVKYYQKAMSILQSMSVGRSEPVALLIHGTPGSGKSLATEVIGRTLTDKLGGHRPYSLPPDPKHFDGYAQQPVVIMDDVGQNPDGEDLKLFCQMVSSTEFVVPMAALEEKGMAFTSKFVLCSTNCSTLTPPTIAEPAALNRRFYMDLYIEVQKDYSRNGKLDASTALNQCQHPAVNFKRCCPLICGKAVLFKDSKTLKTYTIDEIVSRLLHEHQSRTTCGNKIDALFQGVDDGEDVSSGITEYINRRKIPVETQVEWLETEYDKEPSVLKTIDEQLAEGITQSQPMPKEVMDLVRAVPKPEVIQYCEKQGWLVPAPVSIARTKIDVERMCTRIATGLSILASLAAIGGFVYLLYTVFASTQGPYSGEKPETKLKKPELRRKVVAQGPDTEFSTKLMNSSVFDVKTEKGHFSGLGLYDEWLLLPKHSNPKESVSLNGQEHRVVDSCDLEAPQGSLELTAIKLDRPIKFRDIRKYFPDGFHSEPDCLLIVNNNNFKNLTVPVGRITLFGFLNLSHKPVYNTCTYRYPTKSGQCGGVVCKAGKILAMHIGGDGLNGYGAILTKRMFMCLEQGEIKSVKKASKTINVNSKTRFHPSVFYDVFPGSKEPAALSPKDRRLEVDLHDALFSKYKGNVSICDDKELEVAVDHYVEQIRPLLPANVTDPLPLEDVVYGIENLDGLDLNTSAGYPYVISGTRKRDLIPERGQPLTKLQDALNLHGFDLPFVTYLKDELRPLDKVKKGKTRLIECSSLNDTIRMKMTFGRLFQTFHANPGTVTGSAVGCDPDVNWSTFYAEMGAQPLIAFDYSNFDASLGPIWFKGLSMVLRKLGYTDAHLKCIQHIKNSTHLFKTMEYTVEGGMPSGCSGTSIFNSIINNLIIKTLVLKTYKGLDLDHLRIIAYGDDVVASYPFQLDAEILAEEGAKFGLTMTPPDKGSSFNETNWDTVTFLKRRFVPDEEFPFLIHPVFPMSEVYESIRWTKSAANTQEHVTSLCLLAWHNGEHIYNDFCEKIRSVPIGRVLHLPAYTVLRQLWLDKF
uniref:Genome polyprotein n=1 Tax=Chaerephon bat picornavirus TaxID=3141862 RepID=A0AAU7E355_9VIRU